MAILWSRLGPPSSNSFAVAYFCDSAIAQISLQYRVSGAVDWVSGGSITPTAVTGGFRALFSITGLTSSTTYEYRVYEGPLLQVDAYVTTMPDGDGRFIMYHASDNHGDALAETFDYIRTNYEANYEGVPAFIVYTGDLLAALSGITNGASRLPLVYMFDDWDWAGNNSSSTHTPGRTLAEANLAQVESWPDRPTDVPPSYAFALSIANVPLIVTDGRSQKVSGVTGTPCFVGNEEPRVVGYNMLGAAQAAWLVAQLKAAAHKGIVFVVSGTTVKSPIIGDFNISGFAIRDGWLWYSGELADVMSNGCSDLSYRTTRKLTFLSGDDHVSRVYDNVIRYPVSAHNARGFAAHPAPPLPNGPLFREFKVSSFEFAAGSGTTGIGNVWDYREANTGQSKCVAIWDITSSLNGEGVTAAVTYREWETNNIATSPSGKQGVFYYRNGVWSLTPFAAQRYPVENGQGEPVFRRVYTDAILGTQHSGRDVWRDVRDNRLRGTRNVDDDGRDDWTDRVTPRAEGDPEWP